MVLERWKAVKSQPPTNPNLKNFKYQRRRTMKKRVFLSAFISLAFLLGLFGCQGSPTTPNPPPPPPQKTHFQVQFRYTRPAGSILNPDRIDTTVGISICGLSPDPGIGVYELIDDYNFNWSGYYDIPENENDAIYSMYGIDGARYDGVDDSTGVVGEMFFVRVKETGVETQLTNVQPNNTACLPHTYQGPNAKMVQWRLNKNGSVSQY